MSVLKGDYIGFSYNSVHSSDLGIVRVSNGSRFDENLLPTMQDKTVQVPGGDGTYYFGSYFTSRPFSVSFAFDSLTEEQVARLKAHFGDKKIHNLVFDERPYKTWRAKVTGTATLKYIAFAEGKTNRLYKGEGTIQFTCYQPYAICEKKWLSDYEDWANIDEWKMASRMKESSTGYDVVSGANSINLYNAGDIDTHFQLRINFVEKKIPKSKMYLSGDAGSQLAWNEITALGNDTYVKFNSKLNLIEGYNKDNQKTGNIYNNYITEGAFFKIPLGESMLSFDVANGLSAIDSIEYSYYYI